MQDKSCTEAVERKRRERGLNPKRGDYGNMIYTFSAEEVEFMLACHKKLRGRATLTPKEVLEVAAVLGYTRNVSHVS